MKHYLHEIVFDTKIPMEFIDLTNEVKQVYNDSKIADGIVNVFTNHTTAAVKINERCERLQKDMLSLMQKIVPVAAYLHDNDTVDGRPNARSHLMSLLLNASETIPAAAGRLLLGAWQSIFFVELDGPRRARKVTVKIVGS